MSGQPDSGQSQAGKEAWPPVASPEGGAGWGARGWCPDCPVVLWEAPLLHGPFWASLHEVPGVAGWRSV